tara:strand:+ start:9 stop:2030 length:2022 start_codon:yes stop_codon:yes gene_type:complete
MAKTKITPEINFDLSDTEASPVVGRVDGEDVRGEQKVRSMGGRLGFRADTEGMSYGAGVSGGTAKGELDLPSVLEQLGAPDKVKFGSGKIKPQDYDAFLEMADIFGIEGATARVEAGYTPSDYKEDKKRIALKLKYNFAKGGVVPMNNMAKQMEMFQDGGLMDEGGTVDPVSGNDVPPGSTQEEVRDDIPANISEGEFVLPADVVRFIGLEKIMQMRDQAKAGLAKMEAMGQMGNSDEAMLDDDVPFDINDLDMEDEDEYNTESESDMDFAVGGVVPFSGTGIAGYSPASSPTTGYTTMPQPVNVSPGVSGIQGITPQLQYTQATGTTNLPTFGQTIGSSGYDEFKVFVNSAGQTIQVPFKDGKPFYPIPSGFKAQSDIPNSILTATVPDSTLGDTSVRSQEGGDGVSPEAAPFGGNAEFGYSNESLRDATITQAKNQIGMFSAKGNAALGMANKMGINSIAGFSTAMPSDVATAGVQGMNAALSSIGIATRAGITTDKQATMVGNVMAAAQEAASKKGDIQAAIQAALAKQENNTVVKDAHAALNASLGVNPSDPASVTKARASLQAQYSQAVANANDVASDISNSVTSGPPGMEKSVMSTSGPVMTSKGKAAKDAAERTKAELEAQIAAFDAANPDVGGMGFGAGDAASGADDAMGDGGNTTGADESDAVE